MQVKAVLTRDTTIRGMRYPQNTRFSYEREAWKDGNHLIRFEFKTGVETVRYPVYNLKHRIVSVSE